MTLRFLLLMASLMLVDLCITGIFIAVSGRLAMLGGDLIANLALLGGLNALGAWWLFRPVQAFLAGHGDTASARARVTRLPWLASGWAIVCTVCYCVAAFSLGVFAPHMADFTALSEATLVAGMIWYGALYALYYGFYIFFAVSDFTNDLKQRLASEGLWFRPDRGRMLHKLVLVFVVAAFIPSILVAFDLSVFRDLRAAQGLTVEQTIFLDLLASAFLITVSLVFVTRSLVRPINALMVSIQQLGEGRLDVQAPVMSDDELGVLSERFNQMLEGLRDREFLRETFGRYVPEKIAAALLANRGILEPQLKTATILFVDIERFTQIAESQSPEIVLKMLNEYFSSAIEPVTQLGGVVNHFQGDAMLVTFNVPVADPRHADHALTAAMEIQRAIADRTFAGVRLSARIGVNTGEVVAGAVGSDDRLSYTVYGDAVNLASRLERLNKKLGTRVLISGSTVAALEGDFPLQPMGHTTVRGRSEPVSIYALADGTSTSVGTEPAARLAVPLVKDG